MISVSKTRDEFCYFMSTRCLDILSDSITSTANRVYQIYYQFFANGNFISRRQLRRSSRPPFPQAEDSISISSRPEVLRKWLLSHFRRKKSNERTMDAARETDYRRDKGRKGGERGERRDFRVMCLKIGSTRDGG